MKKLYPALIFLLIVSNSFSQNSASITNQYAFGGTSDDYAFKMIDDGTGYLIGGSSKSGVSGDKTEACRGLFDIWLLKTDYTFNIQWQKTIGGSQNDYLCEITEMPDGGYLLLSWTNSGASGDKTVPNYGTYDYWVLRITNTGDILWQKTYGGESLSYSSPFGITTVADNQYIIYGSSNSDSAGVKSENRKGWSDIWLVSIDSTGSIIWDKTIGGNYPDDACGAIYNYSNSSLEIVGTTSSDSSFDITNSTFGGLYDVLFITVNPINGQKINDERFGGSRSEQGIDMVKINNQLFFVSNSTSDSSGIKTEDNRSIDTLDYDFWIIKCLEDGSVVKDKTIGGNRIDNVFGCSVLNNNQFLAYGYSTSGISGEKTEMCKGLSDYWIVSLDTNLNILWQKVIGGNSEDVPKFIHTAAANKFIIGGGSKSGVSGDKTIPSRGGEDFWILEISTTMSIEDFSPQRLHVFPNPVADLVTVELPENSTSGQLYVFDNTGAIVHSEIIDAESNQVNLSNLASGVYFISYFDESGNGWAAEVQKM